MIRENLTKGYNHAFILAECTCVNLLKIILIDASFIEIVIGKLNNT
jgi:hypothetical protein